MIPQQDGITTASTAAPLWTSQLKFHFCSNFTTSSNKSVLTSTSWLSQCDTVINTASDNASGTESCNTNCKLNLQRHTATEAKLSERHLPRVFPFFRSWHHTHKRYSSIEWLYLRPQTTDSPNKTISDVERPIPQVERNARIMPTSILSFQSDRWNKMNQATLCKSFNILLRTEKKESN